MKIVNTPEWYFSMFFYSFRDFSIPLFVMVSGALLVNKDYSVTTFIKKKIIRRLLVPFIFWVCIYIIFAAITVHLNLKLGLINHMSLDVIIKILFGTSGYARVYWFIWMIIVVYIVLFIINKIIKNSKIKNIDLKIYTSILVLFLIYSIIVSLNLFKPMSNTFIYYLSFVGYGVLGYFLSNIDLTQSISKRFRITKKKIIISSLILSIILYILLLLNTISLINRGGMLASLSHFHILKVILASSMFLFFRYLDEYNDRITINSIYNKLKRGITGKLITSLGVCSFGIYLSHMIIKNFYLIYIFNNIELLDNPFIRIPFILLIVLLTSWSIIWIMSKIPYINKISGV